MKKTLKIKKILAGTMALMTALSMNVTAYAESIASDAANPSVGNDPAQNVSTEYQEQNAVYDKSKVGTQVYLTNDTDNVLVSVPKKVILSGKYDEVDKKYKGEYQIKVTGDFAGNKAVHVTPDSNITLTQKGKKDKVATISQDKTQFLITDIANNTNASNGIIKAETLTAGSWNGIFNFDVSIGPILENAQSVQYWNISATPQDDVWMTYYQPNIPTVVSLNAVQQGTQIEKFENGTVVISGIGKMDNDVLQHFFDLDEMTRLGNEFMWATIKEQATPEDYKNLVDDFEKHGLKEGAPIVKYYETENLSQFGQHYELITASHQNIWTIICNNIDNHKLNKNDFVKYAPTQLIVKDGVTNIASSSFYSCDTLTKVQLSNTVEEIEGWAFNGTSITEIDVPASVKKIGSYVFANTPLANVVLHEGLEELCIDAFADCDSLKEVIIPNTVKKISNPRRTYGVFKIDEKNNYYKSVDGGIYTKDGTSFIGFTGPYINQECRILQGTKTIENRAFNGLSSITIYVPDSVTTIINGFYAGHNNKVIITDATIEHLPTDRYSQLATGLMMNSTFYCQSETGRRKMQSIIDDRRSSNTNVNCVVAPEKFV